MDVCGDRSLTEQAERQAAQQMPFAMTADEAREQARAAAGRSGVVIRTVTDLGALQDVISLFGEVWANDGAPPIGLEHLRSLAHAGNYVSAAYDGDEVLGASVAFFALPLGRALHSDIAGVRPGARDRQLGFALKLHQRAWALGLGIEQVTWTFDPLVSRNAHFNLTKLGATGVGYHEDFYGDMSDAINAGQGSDRLLVSWPLSAPAVASRCRGGPAGGRASVGGCPPAPALLLTEQAGQPVAARVGIGAPLVRVAVPDDIEAVRRADPDLARRWRGAVRATMGTELSGGGRVVSFERGAGYLIDRRASDADPSG